MAEALFKSVHSALLYAYTYSATQHGTAAAAERQIALAARERYERTAGSGRGLKGVDGAAQAGQIKNLVARSTSMQFRLCVMARFSVNCDADRDAACRMLAVWMLGKLPPALPGPVALRLIRMATGRQANVAQMAEQEGVPLRTVERWLAAVRAIVRQIELAGMATIEPLLQRAGVVESPDTMGAERAQTDRTVAIGGI